MTTVRLGFMAYDTHELLCHFVAREGGYYDREGLEPELVDATFLADDDLVTPGYVQVACGAAYLARRRGVPFLVVLAGAHQPPFWIVGRPGGDGLTADPATLKGTSLATFPPPSPPHHLLRAILRGRGLDPDRDVAFVPARDDAARLGLLHEGSVAAALVSSATPIAVVADRGFKIVTCLGDHLTFVSSGLATNAATVEQRPDLVAAIVRTFRRSLRTIKDDQEATCRAIERALAVSADVANRTYEAVATRFTPTGRVPLEDLEPGLAVLEQEAPGAAIRADELYVWAD